MTFQERLAANRRQALQAGRELLEENGFEGEELAEQLLELAGRLFEAERNL